MMPGQLSRNAQPPSPLRVLQSRAWRQALLPSFHTIFLSCLDLRTVKFNYLPMTSFKFPPTRTLETTANTSRIPFPTSRCPGPTR